MRAHASVACPRCGGPLDRIPRHGLDRFISLFMPLRRYRCSAFSCEWEGTLRAPQDGSSAYAQARRRPRL